MKKSKKSKRANESDDMRPEYDFDYTKAGPNRFASLAADTQSERQNVLVHARKPWGSGKNSGAPRGRNRKGG